MLRCYVILQSRAWELRQCVVSVCNRNTALGVYLLLYDVMQQNVAYLNTGVVEDSIRLVLYCDELQLYVTAACLYVRLSCA